jgi:hypothetical protein
MNWFWLNIPLATLIFLAITMIPLWLVIKHPDARTHAPGPARRAAGHTAAVPVPVQAVNSAAPSAWPEAARTDGNARQFELAGRSQR